MAKCETEIKEIGLDSDGRLYIEPLCRRWVDYGLIYRSATSVRWDAGPVTVGGIPDGIDRC
jgi:hypothetical protein